MRNDKIRIMTLNSNQDLNRLANYVYFCSFLSQFTEFEDAQITIKQVIH